MELSNVDKVLSIIPAQQVSNAVDRVKILAAIVRQLHDGVLVKDMDYGTIPGTGDKPTLLLPGMEKLMRALNAVPEYIERRVIVDYDKPLFHYEYECRLVEADTGIAIPGGRGLGLCTSMESAFRWRKAERLCPVCGQATIKRSKYAPRNNPNGTPGWWCANDACKTNFDHADERITKQDVGRIENPDIFDQVNAIMKRAKKRALGDAIKGAANVSEYFTVDLEDLPTMHFDEPVIISMPEPEAKPEATKSQPVQPAPSVPVTPDHAPDTGAPEAVDDMPDDLFQKLMKDKDIIAAGKVAPERANTIRKLWAEGAITAEQDEFDRVMAIVDRLNAHRKGAK